MTPSLRRYHRRFWSATIVLLPLLIVGAIISIPREIDSRDPYVDQPMPLPVVVRQRTSGLMTYTLRTDAQEIARQIEIELRNPLSLPEALIYQTGADKGTDPGTLVGKLSSTGTYRFTLLPDTVQQDVSLLVYNPFTNSIVENITF